MWVLGGFVAGDVWSSSDGAQWTQTTALAPWIAAYSARWGHTSAVFNNKIWVMGGNLNNDVWYMDMHNVIKNMAHDWLLYR
jgi:hypothetical protein